MIGRIKYKRSMLSLIAAVLSLLALEFYIAMWKSTPFESSEQPVMVIIFAVLSVVIMAFAAFTNIFHIPNIAGFVMTMATFFTCVAGRVSYVAFYLSGDAMATGFTALLPVTLAFMLASLIVGIVAIFMEKSHS